MQDKIGLPLDDIHILGNVPQCALFCVCALCVFELRDLAFSSCGFINVDCSCLELSYHELAEL
jgi:hypothetical protein